MKTLVKVDSVLSGNHLTHGASLLLANHDVAIDFYFSETKVIVCKKLNNDKSHR